VQLCRREGPRVPHRRVRGVCAAGKARRERGERVRVGGVRGGQRAAGRGEREGRTHVVDLRGAARRGRGGLACAGMGGRAGDARPRGHGDRVQVWGHVGWCALRAACLTWWCEL
jgi:hypothetical protein